ncbi:MAG: cupin domain-containing protein [Oscillospiraceae bacterium]|nr:cupin domain-containing protein [Oscillospiraceae bacterium]
MDIIVKKPTEQEISEMKSCPTWGCEVSEFDWSYNSEEHCILTQGQVTVSYDGKEVSFGVGDYVIFPKGLKCFWKVTKAVEKHYKFI